MSHPANGHPSKQLAALRSQIFPVLAPDLSSSHLFIPSKHNDELVGGMDSFEKQYFRSHVVQWAMRFRHAVAYLARVTRLP
jgi:hypothetical protein